MLTKAQKWGNSLAVRLPHEFVEQLGLKPNADVEISLQEDHLCIVPVESVIPIAYVDLAEMVAKITPENRHSETDWGPVIGKEAR
jgi:antitoxin MazE